MLHEVPIFLVRVLKPGLDMLYKFYGTTFRSSYYIPHANY